MRVMVIIKATENSEAGDMPSEALREKEERLRAGLERKEAEAR